MNVAERASTTMDNAEDQIARLRSQVEALMKDRVTPMVTDAAGRAEAALHSASGAVRGQAAALSGQVRKQPLIAIVVAAGVGFLAGRIIR